MRGDVLFASSVNVEILVHYLAPLGSGSVDQSGPDYNIRSPHTSHWVVSRE